MDPVEILLTEDGSQTVFSKKFNAAYHSHRGAMNESLIVFINAGLQHFIENHPEKHPTIFEMGFGSGLNAILSFQFAETNSISIDYHSIEAFPLSKEIWSNLHFSNNDSIKNVFQTMHTCPWQKKIAISPFFNLTKYQEILESFDTTQTFDIIYFDAFAPNTQPELWEENVIQKMFNFLNPGGILTTYCAKGEFKRCLKKTGFMVESLPGPLGKREIIRASKPI